jgi:hypothetical protein
MSRSKMAPILVASRSRKTHVVRSLVKRKSISSSVLPADSYSAYSSVLSAIARDCGRNSTG